MSKEGRRIEELVALVGPADHLVEVGAHDARITLAAIRAGVAHAIAIDRSAHGCALAREAARGLPIDVRRGEGLAPIAEHEARGVLLIAGVGGPTIEKILSAPLARHFDRWVLGPQTLVPSLRTFVEKAGWRLTDDRTILDRGRRYVLLAAHKL
jgi:tRNA (adenine22-N1)-methyltransferase